MLQQEEIIGKDGEQDVERMVMVQPDEVWVNAQEHTNKQELWIYTAVVSIAKQAYYFTACEPAQLFRQVGALLALCGVHASGSFVC